MSVRSGWQRPRLRRALRRRRRALAAGLAVTAAALAAWGPEVVGASVGPAPYAGAAMRKPAHRPPPVELVSAPVRIADAEAVRLLRPGDRVDVIAAAESNGFTAGNSPGARAHTVATGARVLRVPQPEAAVPDGGALVVLSVSRPVASALAGAGATSRLAVVLC
ncbi:RcpC/CpaB family pilus assembly protein [Streptomyces sp. NPDC127084]|uniref:RcpC/CpaB family pilus assembly protein n=1 Tax=Streptomyces sp. NPDC127084 TaxID=3347133 RepID=UPI003654FBCE